MIMCFGGEFGLIKVSDIT